MSDRRNFLKKATLGATAVTMGSALSAKSYSRVIGANDRLAVAFMGLGRRVPAYFDAVSNKKNNVDVLYLCDVMKSQRDKTAAKLDGKLKKKPKLENDIRKVLADPDVDVLFNAAPDHWHTPGACMAMEAGKHVYLEKPCTHNPREGEILTAYENKYKKIVQIGNQQRSSLETIDIISQIHNGAIGEVYKAVAFYANDRPDVPHPKKAPVLDGLDWELFQGPAPRTDFHDSYWDYNWHWYGWNWGTAESGNNGTHELDVARWALQVDYPQHVIVSGGKRHFKEDGWEMYDTIEATMTFPGNKVIQWDGKSRNGHKTYSSGRGTIIYGSEGSVYVDRDGYVLYDRKGKEVKNSKSGSSEGGLALGGGGTMSTMHVVNFFNAIRGEGKVNSPISQGIVSTYMPHIINIAYRVGKALETDAKTGHIYDRDAMKLWGREYEPGWAPKM
ncbi:MAG: Gfo/Idh/MocA family oxidoreductase [Cyclobacteriaceae bacterium]|nr:Gfo/Idh/MocA family oxidoreductase [Cyclobacteriaceae bacterium]